MTFSGRAVLDQELTELKDNIIQLASAANESVVNAMEALQKRNVQQAKQVVAGD
ncbi:hypothetical protein MNBD_CHLOROFLEXI01-3493, partial [hydrothermal vent metagenome]